MVMALAGATVRDTALAGATVRETAVAEANNAVSAKNSSVRIRRGPSEIIFLVSFSVGASKALPMKQRTNFTIST